MSLKRDRVNSPLKYWRPSQEESLRVTKALVCPEFYSWDGDTLTFDSSCRLFTMENASVMRFDSTQERLSSDLNTFDEESI